MILTQRQSKLIKACLECEDSIRISTLAELVQTSTRTVQREFKLLDEIFREFNLEIAIKNRDGIQIVGDTKDKERLENELFNQVVDYINKEERRNLLIFELLRLDKVEKLIHFANIFRVSEATISHDLDVIEQWFEQFGLHILRKPGLGIEIIGEEANYRQALTSIVHKNIVDNPNYQTMNPYDEGYALEELFETNKGIMKLLDQEILERVIDVLSSHIHELRLDKYTQSSYMGLIIHITIAIKRIKMSEPLNSDQDIKKLITDKKSFAKAEKIARLLENEFEIVIPIVEISYISLHLQCGKEIRNCDISKNSKMDEYINKMIAGLDEKYREALINDQIFHSGLSSHLQPTIIRLKNNLPIYNPLLDDLKLNFEEIFNQASMAGKILGELLDVPISEDEIGFIAMHIGASYERCHAPVNNEKKIRIGIVCASGIGVSALLEARLFKSLDANVKLETMSIEDIESSSCHLLVTTLDLSTQHKNILVVNPLLTMNDIDLIKKKIKEIRQSMHEPEHKLKRMNANKNLKYLGEVSTFILTLCNTITIFETNSFLEKNDVIIKTVKYLEFQKPKEICDAILRRESIGQTIYHEYGFGILHAATDCVDKVSYCLIFPNDQVFKSQSLHDIKFIVFIVIPKNMSVYEKEVISKMNQMVLEQELQELLMSRNIVEIRDYFESMLFIEIQNKLNSGDEND